MSRTGAGLVGRRLWAVGAVFVVLALLLGLHLSIPLVATTRFLAYIDNRTRRDGWDIQVRFLAIRRAQAGSDAEGVAQ